MSAHATWWAMSGADARRWAFYNIGAYMGPIDTGHVHGPDPRCSCRPGSLGFCAGCVGVDFMANGMRSGVPQASVQTHESMRLFAPVDVMPGQTTMGV